MREQFGDTTIGVGRQSGKHVEEIGVRFVPVLLGGGDKAHDGSSAFAGGARTSEEPVLPTDSDGSDGALDRVVMCALKGVIGSSVRNRPGQLSLRPEAQGAVQEATNGLKHFLKRPRRGSARYAGCNVSKH